MLRKMIVFIASFTCMATMMTSSAYAHGAGGHGSVIKAEEVVDLASRYVTTIVESKSPIEGEALDKSWLKIEGADKAIVKEESWYFVVKVHHSALKKTLYMLISKKGKLYRANFSGTFKEFE